MKDDVMTAARHGRSPIGCADKEKSIAELLHDAGYAYRPCHLEGKREVYRASDGKIAGLFDAYEAAYFVKSLDVEPMLPFMEAAE